LPSSKSLDEIVLQDESKPDSRMDQLLAKFDTAMFDFRVAMKSQPELSQVLRSDVPQTVVNIDKVVSQPPVINVTVEPTPVNIIVPEAKSPVINIEPAQVNVNVPMAKAPAIQPIFNIAPTPVTIENQINVPAQPIDLNINVAGTTTVVKRNAMGQILSLENTPKVEVEK